MLSQKFVFHKSKISPLTMKYECPRLSLLIITPVLQTNKIGQSPIM